MLLTVCLLLCTFAVRVVDPVNSTCVLVATPDYPVAAGQTVHLQCSTEPLSPNTSPSYVWQRLENNTWVAVSNGSDVTLAEPNQSGLYECSCFDNWSHASVSQNHTVFIVAIPPTAADDHLEIVAFVFSLLALMVSVAVPVWRRWQKCDVTLPVSNTAKGSSAPEKAPKVTVTQPDDDGDVYMNYSNTNHAYSDLDPSRMAVSSVYSTLS